MMISNKKKMYGLQSELKLGNCLTIWGSPREVRKSSYDGPIAIRSMIPGMGMVTHIDQKDLERGTEEYVAKKGCGETDIIYSEMAAPSMGIRRLLNGELTRFEDGLHLSYGTGNVHMNEAMKNPCVAQSVMARTILETMLDPSDEDDLRTLLEEFEDPVIEFSVLDRPVGWADRRMTVWEVRHY